MLQDPSHVLDESLRLLMVDNIEIFQTKAPLSDSWPGQPRHLICLKLWASYSYHLESPVAKKLDWVLGKCQVTADAALGLEFAYLLLFYCLPTFVIDCLYGGGFQISGSR